MADYDPNKSGVLKYVGTPVEQNLVDMYYGCKDLFTYNDLIEKYDEDILIETDINIPDTITESAYIFIKDMLAKVNTLVDGESNKLSIVYDVSQLDHNLLLRLSYLYDIYPPDDYGTEKLRLLLRYYPIIRKMRGTKKAIFLLLKVLDRSQQDLIDNSEDDIIIEKAAFGEYIINNPRITSVDFGRKLLLRVIRAGIKITFNGV